MLCSLIAWNAQGEIVATLDHAVARDEDGNVVGLIDFEDHESKGGKLRDVWDVSTAVGAATWPEWLGGQAYDFTVELEPKPGPARARITALIHKRSGHRRSRSDIEAAIAERTNEAKAQAKQRGEEQRNFLRSRGAKEETVVEFTDPPVTVDLRDLLGGPNKPLLLDDDGKTMKRPKVERPNLPVVGRG